MRASTNELVSVILPVYNAAGTIRACVKSVLAQSWTDFELLAVDDGSTDGSGALLDEMAAEDPRIRVIHKENGGVSRARNLALDEARGEYIAFIDSDDLAEPGWLREMAEAIRGTGTGTGADAEEPCGMAVCGYHTRAAGAAADQAVSHFKRCVLTSAEVIGRALRYRDITTAVWNKLLRRDVIEAGRLRFATDLSIGEDLVFLVEYGLRIRRAALVPDPLYIYTVSGQSAMGAIRKSRTFQTSWLTEWQAVRRAEALLAERGLALRETEIKKTRVAGKLLLAMDDCGYRDPVMFAELRECLRQNRKLILREAEFGWRMKLNFLLYLAAPGFARRLRRVWRGGNGG